MPVLSERDSKRGKTEEKRDWPCRERESKRGKKTAPKKKERTLEKMILGKVMFLRFVPRRGSES